MSFTHCADIMRGMSGGLSHPFCMVGSRWNAWGMEAVIKDLETGQEYELILRPKAEVQGDEAVLGEMAQYDENQQYERDSSPF
jgi:hypothetical protein